MKIIFFGNADFGLETLEALIHSSQHELLAIVTNPDKRINRNKKNKINPIKQVGLSNEIPVIEQEDISDEDFLAKLKGFKADLNDSLSIKPFLDELRCSLAAKILTNG